jgi:hypothetical protein
MLTVPAYGCASRPDLGPLATIFRDTLAIPAAGKRLIVEGRHYYLNAIPMLASQKQQIIALFQAALTPIVEGSDLKPTVILERPRDPAHGDIACNIAMQLAKPLKKKQRLD